MELDQDEWFDGQEWEEENLRDNYRPDKESRNFSLTLELLFMNISDSYFAVVELL